jgi:hypothetical protein
MTTKRLFAISGLVLAAALAAAGCGGTEQPFSQAGVTTPTNTAPQGTPQARLLASVQRATAARTARFALEMTISGIGPGGAVSFTGTGVMDLVKRSLDMTLTSGGAGASVSLETRVVGGTEYVKTPDGWESEPLVASATPTEPPAPGSALDYLQGVSGDVHVEGHDTLHGDATTRYGATLDLDRALSRITDTSRRAVVKHAMDLRGVAKFPAQVWIDDQGRMRKLALTIDLKAAVAQLGAAPGSDPKITESLELYDFGVSVDVQAPTDVTPVVSAAVHQAESDLRNALTAEKVLYTDDETYSALVPTLKPVEPSLDWGGKLTVVVGPEQGSAGQVVCLAESADGVAYSLADVAVGPRAGAYYGRAGCPRIVDALTVSRFGAHW